MKKIILCAVSDLVSADHAEMANEIDEVVTPELMATLNLQADRESLHEAKLAEDAAFLKQKKSALTVVIKKDSKALCSQSNAIVSKHKAALRSPDATTREHAEAIAVPFQELNHLSRKPYPQQLAFVDDFAGKMQDADNSPHATALSLTADLTLLSSLAGNLRTHLLVRAEDWNEAGQIPGMKDTMTNYNRVLRPTCRNIQAVYEINERGAKNAAVRTACETLIDGLNARFDMFNTRLSHYDRKNSLGHHQKPDNERPEGPEPNVPDNGSGGNNNGGADKPPNPESKRLAELKQLLPQEMAEISKLYAKDAALEKKLAAALKKRNGAKTVATIQAQRAELQKTLDAKLVAHHNTLMEYHAVLAAAKKWDEEQGGGAK
jgi:hypothetical protein